MIELVKKEPFRSFEKSPLSTWLKLYDDFLDERDKQFFD